MGQNLNFEARCPTCGGLMCSENKYCSIKCVPKVEMEAFFKRLRGL